MSRFGEYGVVAVMALVIACSGCGRTETSATHASREIGTLGIDHAYCLTEYSRTATAGEKCMRKIHGTTEDGRPMTVYTGDAVSCDRAGTVVLARTSR